ncbi:MAG: hypothetical protein ACPGVO_00885 [Spirulinaceae cyanobacterium]
MIQSLKSQTHRVVGFVGAAVLAVSLPLAAVAQNPHNLRIFCNVRGLQNGQLALRSEPGGEAIAGLENDDLVEFMQSVTLETTDWSYVRVFDSNDATLEGREGYVNSSYLACWAND